MNALVIIPTYNEIENIEKIIRAVFFQNHGFHILIIDDGSKDGTANAVKDLQKEFSSTLFLLERSGKLGLGTAYLMGFQWALTNHYDYVFEMDADFSHSPTDLVRLYQACAEEGFDMSIGSRYVKGGDVKNWDKKRIFISQMGSLYTRIITGLPIYDTTAGFVCYTKKVLQTLDLNAIQLSGYGFQIEMKFKTHQAGFKIKEVPITFIDRVEGVSKMSSGIITEAMKGVLRLQWNHWTKKKT